MCFLSLYLNSLIVPSIFITNAGAGHTADPIGGSLEVLHRILQCLFIIHVFLCFGMEAQNAN